jgi:hypothetical protein
MEIVHLVLSFGLRMALPLPRRSTHPHTSDGLIINVKLRRLSRRLNAKQREGRLGKTTNDRDQDEGWIIHRWDSQGSRLLLGSERTVRKRL